MQTPFRFVPLAFLAALAAAQDGATARFAQTFGTPGSVGGFHAEFSPFGAGMTYLQATDHAVSLAAARKAERAPGDWLLLLWNGDDHMLRLGHAGAAPAAFAADPATAAWTVARADGAVTFTLDGGDKLTLEKTLRHDPRQRGFTLEIALRNAGSTATGALELVLGGPVPVLPHESSLFGNPAVAIAAPNEGDVLSTTPQPGVQHAFPLDGKLLDGKALAFAGSTNRFFGAFVWPKDDVARVALAGMTVDTLPVFDDDVSATKANTTTRVNYALRLPIPAVGAETRATFGLYLGPKSYRVFAALPEPERFAPILDVDLKSPCCGFEMPGGRPMAKLLLALLGWFHDLVGNWGFAIVMLTILVRGLMLPLNFRMQKSMREYSKRMAVLKPKMDALKQKHGDDQRAYQQAMLAFQREHKLMPPLGGCLPIFLTMPIYIGLFTALRTAYDVRQQPFVGWIEDLSQPDMLLQLSFWPHVFNLLPLVWIGMFLWLQTRMPLPTDPQQRQMQQMMRYMPILFGVMLYSYAAALLVYMVTSMAWSMVENAIVKKVLGPMDPNVAAMAPQPI
jgi:YidC/Oxa1 family membrane protein insertase